MFPLLLGILGLATTLHIPVERYRLDNGLIVILHEDRSSPNVVVNLLFEVGSKDERLGRSGFAHLFEHLMFMGTKNAPNGAFDTIMESAGGTNSAFTAEDYTNYYESGAARLLETFLWLEADRLSSLPDAMTKAKVDLQRDVVKNERRQSYENQPYGRVELELPEQLYPANHPYHHPVIGSHADLTAASVEDVKSFFREYYAPSNAILVVSGSFSSPETNRLIDRYFGSIPKQPVPAHAAPQPIGLSAPVRVTLKDAVQLPQVVLAWHSPAAFADGDAACDLVAALLGAGQSSRLYRALVHDQKLAQSVRVNQRSAIYGSSFTVTATAQSGHTAKELEAAIDAELARLDGPAPPTDRELARARAFVQTRTLSELESPVGLAFNLAYYDFALGDASQLEKRQLSRYDDITIAAVRAWSHQVLDAPRVTITVEPERGVQ